MGDLGNLTSDPSGQAMVNISDSIIQFYNSTQSIANRTVIVHRMFDDGGQGASASLITGLAFDHDFSCVSDLLVEMLALELLAA